MVTRQKGEISMNYILLISHGELAPGLKSACEMMTGPITELLTVNLPEGISTAVYEENFRKVIEVLDWANDQLIILTDIIGGSPFSKAVEVLSEKGVLDRCVILAGMNLAMAITAVLKKDLLSTEELINEVLAEGQSAVRQFSAVVETESEEL